MITAVSLHSRGISGPVLLLFWKRVNQFLARLFEEHGELLQFPRRERQYENVKVFGASNLETCH